MKIFHLQKTLINNEWQRENTEIELNENCLTTLYIYKISEGIPKMGVEHELKLVIGKIENLPKEMWIKERNKD